MGDKGLCLWSEAKATTTTPLVVVVALVVALVLALVTATFACGPGQICPTLGTLFRAFGDLSRRFSKNPLSPLACGTGQKCLSSRPHFESEGRLPAKSDREILGLCAAWVKFVLYLGQEAVDLTLPWDKSVRSCAPKTQNEGSK